VICGFKTFVEIEDFANERIDFFRKCLDLRHGIPSHDRLGGVFGIIDSAHFAECFEEWTSSLREAVGSDIVAFDGKSICGSFDVPKNKAPIHLMNVWSSENSICLAQMRCDVKGNEIISLEKLIGRLSLDECVVTADAMHCHKATTRQISEAKANYALGLKKNEIKMYSNCVDSFELKSSEIHTIKTSEKGHGRVEERIIDFLEVDGSDEKYDGWINFNGFVRITTNRTYRGKSSTETRYYITSLNDIKEASKAVRYHWQIENNLHWVLDNAFSEDKCRLRTKNAGENLAYIRKIALNLFSKDEKKISIKRKMLKALLNEAYLESILANL